MEVPLLYTFSDKQYLCWNKDLPASNFIIGPFWSHQSDA